MSRYDLRFAWRHPLRWLRIWWLHLALAGICLATAWVWTADIFAQVLQPNLWPIAMGVVAGLIVASAIAPFDYRLRAVVGAAIITLGVVRAGAMAEVFLFGDANRHVVAVLGLHALILAAVGAVWPEWTAACASRATVEAGREDRGGQGA